MRIGQPFNLPTFSSSRKIATYAARHKISMHKAVYRLLVKNVWPERFRRNVGLLDKQSQASLLFMPIFIAGCGGLGGTLAEMLVRLGAANLYLCDYDSFEESNLNRQRFCTEKTLGLPKALVTAEALKEIIPWASFVPVTEKLTEFNIGRHIKSCAILIDCLDSVDSKKMLQQAAHKARRAWLHGSVLHNEGFACLESTAGNFLSRLYRGENEESGAGSVLPHVVNGVAALMCSLFTRWLLSCFSGSSPLLHLDFSVPEIESFHIDI